MLIESATQFPTVVFTIGLAVVLVYWLFVLLGALDIDMFHADAEVGGHDVGGGDAGGDAGDAGDGDGHDIDAEGGGFWHGMGLARVPITISLSAIFLVCWCISLVAMHYLPSMLGDASWVGPAMLPATLIVGLPIAGLLVRPLGRVFEFREGKSNKDYVGHTCTITTGHVDEHFGQATIEDGGDVLVIPVRCDKTGLARNDKALVIDFDNDRHAYVVEPATDMLPVTTTDTGKSA